ncbi:unnamed protein product [Clonostachys rosea]|uniref:Uncharacterized protein n=1 Tax=Bionectria ochroleuca TaxID=29856 RepID=A0ABY6UKZ4_BIOOC|nr:unnamed protein product [Clonostachys rosea]
MAGRMGALHVNPELDMLNVTSGLHVSPHFAQSLVDKDSKEDVPIHLAMDTRSGSLRDGSPGIVKIEERHFGRLARWVGYAAQDAQRLATSEELRPVELPLVDLDRLPFDPRPIQDDLEEAYVGRWDPGFRIKIWLERYKEFRIPDSVAESISHRFLLRVPAQATRNGMENGVTGDAFSSKEVHKQDSKRNCRYQTYDDLRERQDYLNAEDLEAARNAQGEGEALKNALGF